MINKKANSFLSDKGEKFIIRQIVFLFLSLVLIAPALIPVFSIFYAKEMRVCGVDNKNYADAQTAESYGIQISYDFPCQFPKKENGLFEREDFVEFTGILLDYFDNAETEQFYLKDNFDKSERVVLKPKEGNTINKYFPGDQITVIGSKNKNTEIVEAETIKNNSLQKDTRSIDCTIVSIENKNILCSAENNNFKIKIKDNTRIVSGYISNAHTSDLAPQDLIRANLDYDNNSTLIMVLQRGNFNYFKNHIFISMAKFVSASADAGEEKLIVNLPSIPESVKWLNSSNDLNIFVSLDNNTRLVKKYFGIMSINDFKEGDEIFIIAKANDEGSIKALTIKNNSVWK